MMFGHSRLLFNQFQLFEFERSCFSNIQVHSKAAASCPSCMLAIILLRYTAQEDAHYWRQVEYSEMRLYLNETRRKQALEALLSHWQTIICPQVKVIVLCIIFMSKFWLDCG